MSLTQFSDEFITSSFNSEHYELLHKIGEGGFGKVFKAKHKNTNQLVAIKFLALEPHCEEQKKQRYIERFKRETELSSQLQHPHIVRLLDRGQVNEDILYGVFEYVEGVSLREHLTTEHALDSVTATDVMLQVLDALIHAHQKGIIHRDIKPANIMLTNSGAKIHAKILDFGIGTLVTESRQPDFNTLTLTQETLGTPSYSAPEQLRGEPASAKSDLYVWGLVFLECLTGLPAVTGNSIASIYHKQLSDVHIPIPSALLGHPLAELLRRVLHKNATERVITGNEIYSDLSSINVSNLVGVLADANAQHGFDDTTVLIRDDDPNHRALQEYTALTERKQLTVLAVRLSVKALNNSDKDYDVIDTVYKSQRNNLIDIATRYGAYHVGNLSDTCLFYYGYPVTSDNDTRLCARTALEMVSELSKRNALMHEAHNVAINVHLGMHTGVFITYANAVPEGYNANIAVALSREAGEKQILCTAESRAILDSYSEFTSYGQAQMGPIFDPIDVYNLVGERRVEAFGFMRGTRNNHELIGRHQELEQTLSLIKADNNNTRIAHIHGEAGIGKSRLLQEIRANSAQFQHLVAQCLPEHQNNALYPILTLLRYLFNTTNLDTKNACALFSKHLKEQDSTLNIDQTLPILLVWLNIELGEELQPSALAPDAQKELLYNGLSALLLANQHSLNELKLYIVEDIHWADSATLEFLHHFAQKLTSGHVLLSTSRQDIPSQLQDLTLMDVNLKKLTEQATEDFIAKLFDGHSVARNVLDVLVSRTDGIPLFIEELVGMLKQKGLVADSNGTIDFVSPDKLDQVPTSLRESLQQKLDSLLYAKETAQLAATIGREFEYDLLVAASPLSENQVQNDLNELIENDLIIHQRRVDNDSYIFKHALVRDAAYESSNTQSRVNFHQKVAHSMTNMSNEMMIEPLIISAHFHKANQFDEAVEYRLKAIDKQVKSSAHMSAIEISDEALCWDEFQGTTNKNSLLKELDIYKSMLPSIMTLFGYGAERVLEWGEHVGRITTNELFSSNEKQQLFDMYKKSKWTLFMSAHYASHRVKARKLGEDLLTDVTKYGTRQDKVVVLVHLAQAYNIDGDLLKAKQLYEQALSLYEDDQDDVLALEYGMNIKVQILALASYNYLHLGELSKAKEFAYAAEKIGEQLDSIGEIVFANIFIALYHIFLKQHEYVVSNWERFNDKYSKQATGNVFHLHYLECYSYSSARETILSQLALNKQIETGQTFATGYYVTHLAEAYIEEGKLEEAINLIQTSLERCIKQGEHSVLPFVKKTYAQCLYLKYSQATDGIIKLLSESISDAQSQDAKFFELESRYLLYKLANTTENLTELKKLYTWFSNHKETLNSPLFNELKVLFTKEN
ncbi:Serine/threonine-protein kinase PknD [Pseudoalteromonas sp. CIP111854]|uniref:Serine/threonine-protein kinase PknD n=1 Tax=Pseudoalteromonas holothuriae TaxID=2963714 RepID=A0A9W4VWV5_9GAMM|nr:TOMM system kinase/cyclase fusion protein [Pseudoalteromonas sp. CIP111854]CAH9052987.1 Serine/threonine-protein kinase PknD [Pseudoalteromonas sp. CIP111854]